MKFIITIMFLFITNICSAATFDQAKVIYQKLINSNGIAAPRLEYINSDVVNAYTTPNKIQITKGMLKFVQNSDELALILGHELAHYNLHHSGSTPPREYAADALGARYMANSGFNKCNGSDVFRRFHDKGGSTHPDSDSRADRICRKFN